MPFSLSCLPISVRANHCHTLTTVCAVIIVFNGIAAARYHVGFPVLARVVYGIYGVLPAATSADQQALISSSCSAPSSVSFGYVLHTRAALTTGRCPALL